MKRMIHIVLSGLSVVICLTPLAGGAEPAVQHVQAGASALPQHAAAVTMIQATRTTPEAMCGLTAWVHIGGAAVPGAIEPPRVRYQITRAVDDTGADLMKSLPAPKPPSRADALGVTFEGPQNRRPFSPGDTFMVNLKLPSRKALTIKELSGVAEVFYAQRDAEAMIKVKDLVDQKRLGVSHPSLRAVGATITIVSAVEFSAMQERAERDKMLAAAKRQITRKPGDEPAKDLQRQMLEGLASQFMASGFEPSDDTEYSVVVLRDDPNDCIVDIEFIKQSGDSFFANRSVDGTIGGKSFTRYDFVRKIVPSTVMRITVATPKSVATVPFTVNDVLLP